jgi:hypothetical protein
MTQPGPSRPPGPGKASAAAATLAAQAGPQRRLGPGPGRRPHAIRNQGVIAITIMFKA